MKRLIKIFGIVLVFVGSMFKIQHWPGATIFIIAGLVIYCISLFVRSNDEKGSYQDVLDAPPGEEPVKKKHYYLKEVGLTTLCVGLFLRLYDFPFSVSILAIGLVVLIINQVVRK